MSTPPASFLRLHVEPPSTHETPTLESMPGLVGLCRAFESATGWQLNCESPGPRNRSAETVWSAPLSDGHEPIGSLSLTRLRGEATTGKTVDTANASRLAAAIGELVNGRLMTETALWQREAELATCVPVVARADEAELLAQRLEAVLKAGAEAVGCTAAGLYLLDADTTLLKLRSMWGLPRAALAQSPRLLSAAMADLEALSGHAVVLEKAALAEVWSLPEPFPAAVCVPVSTPNVPLGTLWIFSDAEKPFSDVEVNLAEVIAGRLAAELERETLLAESQQANRTKRQVIAAHDLERNAASQTAPLIEGWDVAGWALQSQELGGAYFEWCAAADSRLVCALGEAGAGGIASALTARTIRAATISHAEHIGQPANLLKRVNRSACRQSSGDQIASLCLATIEPATGRVLCAWAGHGAILHIRNDHYELLCRPSCPLGLDSDSAFSSVEFELRSGEAIVLCSPSLSRILIQPGHRLNAATLATMLIDHLGDSALNLSELIRSCCESQALELDQSDRGASVLKRQ